jgi:hypothetical protein
MPAHLLEIVDKNVNKTNKSLYHLAELCQKNKINAGGEGGTDVGAILQYISVSFGHWVMLISNHNSDCAK